MRSMAIRIVGNLIKISFFQLSLTCLMGLCGELAANSVASATPNYLEQRALENSSNNLSELESKSFGAGRLCSIGNREVRRRNNRGRGCTKIGIPLHVVTGAGCQNFGNPCSLVQSPAFRRESLRFEYNSASGSCVMLRRRMSRRAVTPQKFLPSLVVKPGSCDGILKESLRRRE